MRAAALDQLALQDGEMVRRPVLAQRWIFATLCQQGKPMTFAELRTLAEPDAALGLALRGDSLESSLRRALNGMIRDKIIVALGTGGRADPYRYAINSVKTTLSDCEGS
jgi:hypothetical protein